MRPLSHDGKLFEFELLFDTASLEEQVRALSPVTRASLVNSIKNKLLRQCFEIVICDHVPATAAGTPNQVIAAFRLFDIQ